jgi:signal transduction histidine kinase
MTNTAASEMLDSLIPEKGVKKFLIELINSFPNFLALLDDDRRIVYSNSTMLEALSAGDFENLFKLRPGDLLQCVNASKGSGGCGTAEECELCGAMQSMEQSRTEGKTITRQFRVLGSLKGKTSSRIFRFTSTPFQFDENFYYLVTLEDISHEIRKTELEQIFFHDMMNAIGGLHGVIELLKRNDGIEPLHIDILEASYNTMYDSVREQKQYTQAESGELTVREELLHTQDLVIETALPFQNRNTYNGSVMVADDMADLVFTSDSALLSRILTNMIKNAVEASSEKDIITVGATIKSENLRFWVHNPGAIPRETQMQIFERSFSTKGRGRGIGTYSMKLLGENYLDGKVDFSSNEKEGTTFWIDLPMKP